MALKDKLNREIATAGSPCSVGRALKSLPPGELEVFIELLGTPERPGKPAAYIYAAMQAERRDLLEAAATARSLAKAAEFQALADVFDVGHQTINRHRGQKCRCDKDAA